MRRIAPDRHHGSLFDCLQSFQYFRIRLYFDRLKSGLSAQELRLFGIRFWPPASCQRKMAHFYKKRQAAGTYFVCYISKPSSSWVVVNL